MISNKSSLILLISCLAFALSKVSAGPVEWGWRKVEKALLLDVYKPNDVQTATIDTIIEEWKVSNDEAAAQVLEKLFSLRELCTINEDRCEHGLEGHMYELEFFRRFENTIHMIHQCRLYYVEFCTPVMEKKINAVVSRLDDTVKKFAQDYYSIMFVNEEESRANVEDLKVAPRIVFNSVHKYLEKVMGAKELRTFATQGNEKVYIEKMDAEISSKCHSIVEALRPILTRHRELFRFEMIMKKISPGGLMWVNVDQACDIVINSRIKAILFGYKQALGENLDTMDSFQKFFGSIKHFFSGKNDQD